MSMSDPSFGGAPRPCGPSTNAEVEAAARRGYSDACFDVEAALPAFDMSLQPFDIMTPAPGVTLTKAAGIVWTDVAVWPMPGGEYGILNFIGQDCDDATAYQRVTWRVLRNDQAMGGDVSGLIPAIEARCGILDGTMMPFRMFIQPGGYVKLQAYLSVGTNGDTAIVRGRLQGERRNAYGVRT